MIFFTGIIIIVYAFLARLAILLGYELWKDSELRKYIMAWKKNRRVVQWKEDHEEE